MMLNVPLEPLLGILAPSHTDVEETVLGPTKADTRGPNPQRKSDRGHPW